MKYTVVEIGNGYAVKETRYTNVCICICNIYENAKLIADTLNADLCWKNQNKKGE